MSESKKYRTWTAQQKIEIVLAGMRGDRTIKEVCRDHQIAETLYYGWRDKLLEGGMAALAGKEERSGERELGPVSHPRAPQTSRLFDDVPQYLGCLLIGHQLKEIEACAQLFHGPPEGMRFVGNLLLQRFPRLAVTAKIHKSDGS